VILGRQNAQRFERAKNFALKGGVSNPAQNFAKFLCMTEAAKPAETQDSKPPKVEMYY
jgi:hypothetical protein